MGSPGAAPEFDTLVDKHYAALYRFAMSLTGAENDAADLVQETFFTWARKGHQLQDRSRAKSWLFTTLHRLFLETKRRVTRFPHVEISSADEELPAFDADMINRIDAQAIVEMLNQIDPQYKAAVALFYLEDLSYDEIGQVLEIPLGTVKSRISRGISQLKVLLGKRLERSLP